MNTKMTHHPLTRPIAFRNQLRDRHHASFIKAAADNEVLSHGLTTPLSHGLTPPMSPKLARRTDEASQDLLFACMSFVLLLTIAVADVVFRI